MRECFSDTFRELWMRGAARAFFVCAYAAFVEDRGQEVAGYREARRRLRAYPKPGGGEDWYDFAPPTPLEAFGYAGELWGRLSEANQVGVHSLAVRAQRANAEKPVDPEKFGMDMAMEAMGHGCGWEDTNAVQRLVRRVSVRMEVSYHSFDPSVYEPVRKKAKRPR